MNDENESYALLTVPCTSAAVLYKRLGASYVPCTHADDVGFPIPCTAKL